MADEIDLKVFADELGTVAQGTLLGFGRRLAEAVGDTQDDVGKSGAHPCLAA